MVLRLKPHLNTKMLLMLAARAFAFSADAADQGVTKDTIKIGMFGPLTGPVSLYGYPILNGAAAVYKKANDEGGIHGRKIDLVYEDDVCHPAKTRAAVKKLISSAQVFAIH